MDWTDIAKQMRAAVMLYTAGLDDADAVTVPAVYPTWAAGAEYAAQAIVQHGGRLYRVEQAHTAQAHQPPGGDGMLAIYRPLRPPTTDPLPWIYGEPVEIGDKRIDPMDGLVYVVYTPAGVNVWQPHDAPAIWQVFTSDEPAESEVH